MNFKYKLLLSFILFNLLTANVFCQYFKIDSLKEVLSNYKYNDTTRVNLLNNLAQYNFQSDIELTKLYLKEAEGLSNKLNYTKGKASVLYIRGILESIKSNYSKSLYFFNRSLKLSKSIQNKKGIANIHVAFGITYFELSEYKKTLINYEKAIEIYKELGNKREIITCLINTGNVYSEIGNYTKAISSNKKALLRSEAINDKDGISFVNNNLGVICSSQGNYPLALDYFNKCLEYNKKTKDTLAIIEELNYIGDTYTATERLDKALEYHNLSLKYSKQKRNKRLEATSNNYIGRIYLHTKEYSKALKYYFLALEKSQEINNVKQAAISFNNIGEVYLLLNKPTIAQENYVKAKNITEKTNNKKILSTSLLGIGESYLLEKKYTEALTYIKKGKKIAEELELLIHRKKASNLLYITYKNLRDYKKSLINHEHFKKLNDSLFNKKNIRKFSQLEYEYQYKKRLDSANVRELQLAKTVVLTSKNLEKTTRNFFIAIIIILVVILIFGGIIFSLKLKNSKEKNHKIIIEQKLLRSQMTPHFIFNSLSVLQGMILSKEEKNAVTFLGEFSKLIRTVLENSRQKSVLLSKELSAIKHYIKLQNLATDPPYQFNLKIGEDINTTLLKIPPMLIQPFIENAIEHAFINKKKNKKIDLELSFEDKNLVCIVKDNGIGINLKEKKKVKNKSSLATSITSERLKILAKEYKLTGSLSIENREIFEEQGTLVVLVIPYTIETS